MIKIRFEISELNSELINFNGDISFWGGRLVHKKFKISGDKPLNLSHTAIKAHALIVQNRNEENSEVRELIGTMNRLYKESDDKIASSNFLTRTFVWIRESFFTRFNYRQFFLNLSNNPVSSKRVATGQQNLLPAELIQQTLPNKKNPFESPKLSLATELFNNGELDEAYEAVKNSRCKSEMRGLFSERLADAWFAIGNYDKAYELIKDGYVDKQTRGLFAVKLAEHYFANDNYDKAYEFIKDGYVDKTTRGLFAVKLAEHYFASGNYDKAYELIKDGYVDQKTRGLFAVKLAERYFSMDDHHQAYAISRDSNVDKKSKERFTLGLLGFLKANNQDEKVIHLIIDHSDVDSVTRRHIVLGYAEDFLQNKKYDYAIRCIFDSSIEENVRNDFISKFFIDLKAIPFDKDLVISCFAKIIRHKQAELFRKVDNCLSDDVSSLRIKFLIEPKKLDAFFQDRTEKYFHGISNANDLSEKLVLFEKELLSKEFQLALISFLIDLKD